MKNITQIYKGDIMRKSIFIVLLLAFTSILLSSCSMEPPEQERLLAEKAFRNAAIGKDCDKENYLAAEELLKQAREAINDKDYEKAKELFLAVKKKSDAVMEYYRSHPDECMPKKEDDSDGAEDDVAEEIQDPADDPNMEMPVIHFEFNESAIRAEDEQLVERVAKWLGNFEEISLQIEGHADERGSIDYNMSLGEKRAREVMNRLIQLGVARNRLRIISYGEERPADTGHTESAWDENRRAEFTRLN